MDSNINLTEGSITESLVRLAIPIMATSFVQMAYSLMDMIWLGRVGTKAVAAAGTVGYLTWFASALFMIPRIGAEIGISQSYGKKDMVSAKKYVSHTLQLGVLIGGIYGLFLIVFRHKIIGFFDLGDPEVIKMAIEYLVIISIGMVFYFINPVFSGIFNGFGNSTTPFRANATGLVINMILDPLLIMGIGPFPEMGIKGAALATIIAQFLVTIIFLIVSKRVRNIFSGIKLFQIPAKKYLLSILKLGVPAATQTGIFSIIGMIVAKIIAQWGPTPIAVQNVGSQIESISWMTAGGFSTAISVFVGQNYGARKWERIHKGYRQGLKIVGVIGVFATILLVFGARPVFRLFIPDDPEALGIGISYLRILGLSQIFMVMEIATQGAFYGLGRTIPPAVVGIGLNLLRIPAALILSSTFLGLDGIWWTVSISATLKGIILTGWYIIEMRKMPKVNE